MKSSTEIGSSARYIGYAKAVEAVAKSGFDAFDFSLISLVNYNWQTGESSINGDNPLNKFNYVQYARQIKRIGLDNGILCNQSHAPFPVSNQLIKSQLKKSIEITAEAGGEYCIIHPNNAFSAKKNAEMFNELLPFAKEHNVKIATENMWGWDSVLDGALPEACGTPEDFNAHLDVVDDEFLVACLDIGHAEMFKKITNAPDFIRALGKRLKCLHIHDNDLKHDSHLMPFLGKIDFSSVVKALKEVDYKGYFTLECDAYMISRGKNGEEEVYNGLKDLNSSVNELIDMFENQ